MNEQEFHVLLVTREEGVCSPLSEVQSREALGGLSVASTIDAAWGHLNRHDVQLICIDEAVASDWNWARAQTDAQLIAQIKNSHAQVEIVFLTVDREQGLHFLDIGASHYLVKPLNKVEFGHVVARFRETQRLRTVASQLSSAAKSTVHPSDETPHELYDVYSSYTELDRLLGAPCRAAVEMLKVDHSGLMVFDSKLKTGRVVAEYPKIGAQNLTVSLHAVPIESYVRNFTEPIQIPDITKDYSFDPVNDVLMSNGIRSILVLPVINHAGRLLGSIGLDTKDCREYSLQELEFCKGLANQAGAAIENAILLKRNERLAEQQTEQLRALQTTASLREILEQAVVRLRAQNAGIYQYNSEREELTVILDFKKPEIVGMILKKGEGMAGGLLQGSEEFMIINDYDSWPGKPPIYANLQDFGAVLGVKLKWKNRVNGVLYVNDVVGRTFTREDARILALVANAAAVAIDNASLLHEIEQIRSSYGSLIRRDPISDPEKATTSIRDPASDTAATAASEKILASIVEQAKSAADAATVSLTLFDSNLKRKSFICTAKHVDEAQFDAISQRVIETGQPIAIDENRIQTVTASLGHKITSIGIPFRINANPAGVMWVQFAEARVLNRLEVGALQVYMEQASTAFERVKEIEELEPMRKEKARLAAALSRTKRAAKTISQLITVESDVKKVLLQKVVESAKDALECDAVTLFVYNESKGRFEPETSVAGVIDVENAVRCENAPRDATIYRMLEQEKIYKAERILEDEYFKHTRFTKAEGIRSMVAVPLRALDQRVGVMFVNYRSQHEFTLEELSDIQLFADQAAIAIYSWFEQDRNKRKIESLKALYEASQEVTRVGLGKRKEILDKILEELVTCLPKAILGTIQIYDPTWQAFLLESIYARPGIKLSRPIGERTNANEALTDRIGIVGRAVRDKELQRVDNVKDDPDYRDFFSGTVSEMAAPLIDRGTNDAMGVLNVESDREVAFDKDDEQTMLAFADLTATIIQSADRLEAQTTLAHTGMASSVWGHYIRGQASNIHDAIAFLREKLQTTSSDSELRAIVENRLSTIDQMAAHLVSAPIATSLSYEDGASEISINELVAERIKHLWKYEPYSRVLITPDLTPQPTTVRASELWLNRVLDVLVDNAIQAMKGKEVQELKIATTRLAHDVEIRLADTGCGIPQNIQPRLFYRRIERHNGRKGWGVGLLMAQSIVQTYGGLIRVESSSEHGTVMTIRLPYINGDGVAA